jgi:hypothetical protein
MQGKVSFAQFVKFATIAKQYRKEVERQLKSYQAAQVIGAAGMAELLRRVQQGKPLGLSPADVLKFTDIGIKGARLVLGYPTEHTVNETVTPPTSVASETRLWTCARVKRRCPRCL